MSRGNKGWVGEAEGGERGQGRSQFYQQVSKVFNLGVPGWTRVQGEIGGVRRKAWIGDETAGTEDTKAVATSTRVCFWNIN